MRFFLGGKDAAKMFFPDTWHSEPTSSEAKPPIPHRHVFGTLTSWPNMTFQKVVEMGSNSQKEKQKQPLEKAPEK